MALALQADNPEPSTAARLVVVHGGVAHRSSFAGLQGCAPHEEQVQVEADGVGPLPHQRGFDQLASTGSLPIKKGGRHRGGCRHAGGVVAHPAPLKRGVAARGGQQAGDARAGPEGGDVVGGPVGVGTLGAVAGDQAVDETGEPFADRRVVQAEALEGADPQVGDEYVGAGQQVHGNCQALFGTEVHGDAPLGAVVHLEDRVGGHIATQHPLEQAARIPRRRLDLDHVGTPVGQNAPSRRTGEPHAELHDLHPPHRARRLGRVGVGVVHFRRPVVGGPLSGPGATYARRLERPHMGPGYLEQTSPNRPLPSTG